VNSNIDICVFTETSWLKDVDAVTIAALSPNGYCFQNSPRENDRSGGGVGVMYKSVMRTKLMDANQFRSFEFSEWNVMIQNQVIKLVGVYRPPSSTNDLNP
jgi:hypothetical protein